MHIRSVGANIIISNVDGKNIACNVVQVGALSKDASERHKTFDKNDDLGVEISAITGRDEGGAGVLML